MSVNQTLIWGCNTESNLRISTASAILVGGYVVWKCFFRPYLESKHPIPGLPCPPRCHWLMGHLWIFHEPYTFEESMQNLSYKFANDQGRTCMWLGPNLRTIMITRLDDIKCVLHSEYMHRPVLIFRKHIQRFVGEKNIFWLKGEIWKHQRANIMRAFSPSSLKASKSAMMQVTAALVESIKQRLIDKPSIVVDVEQLMKMITLDTLGMVAFSHPFRSCENLELSPIAEAFDFLGKDLFRRMSAGPMKPTNFFYSIPTSANLQHAKANGLLKQFVAGEIQHRQSLLQEQVELPKDIVTRCIQAQQAVQGTPLGAECTDQVLRDVLMSVLFGGYDTTSVTLSYAIYMLGTHPHICRDCIEEIKRVGPDKLEDLVLLRAVVKEVLRLYPPAFVVPRFLQKDVQLSDGFVLPAHVNVYIPIWAIQRSSQNFVNPESFRPDRWVRKTSTDCHVWIERRSDESTEIASSLIQRGNENAFLAFSGGARNCAGKNFAWQESILVLAGLLPELEFKPVKDHKLSPERNGVIQHPKGGIPMEMSTSRVDA